MIRAAAFCLHLSRPLLAFNILVALFSGLVLGLMANGDDVALVRETSANLLLVIPPGWMGAVCGIALTQLFHCGFAWRLPHLIRHLASPFLASALGCATAEPASWRGRSPP